VCSSDLPNPKPQTPNPKPQTPNPDSSRLLLVKVIYESRFVEVLLLKEMKALRAVGNSVNKVFGRNQPENQPEKKPELRSYTAQREIRIKMKENEDGFHAVDIEEVDEHQPNKIVKIETPSAR